MNIRYAVARTAPAAVLLTVTTLALPAAADSVRFADPYRDAPARFDIGQVSVTNSVSVIRARTKIRRIATSGTQIHGLGITTARGSVYYSLNTVRRPNGTTTAALTRYGSDGSLVRVACRVTRAWRINDSRIDISIPRTCISEAGGLRVASYIGVGNGTSGDPADFTKSVRVDQS